MAGLTAVLYCDNGGAEGIIILFCDDAGGGTLGDRETEGSVIVSHCVITGAKGNCKRFSVIILLKVLSEEFCSDVKGGTDGP